MSNPTTQSYELRQPEGFEFLSMRLTDLAVKLLNGETVTEEGRRFSNQSLFYDLLSRASFLPTVGTDFRRPLLLKPGQAQYSEPRLAAEWGMGRSRLRTLFARMQEAGLIITDRSSIGSVMSFPSVTGWKLAGRPYVANPLYDSANGG